MQEAREVNAPDALGDKKRNASQEKNREVLPVLTKYRLRRVAQDLLPGFAVRKCQHEVAFGREGVTVLTDGQNAWFEGAVPCGSVWTCPVCAARIAEKRAREVQAGIDAHLEAGGGVLLLTLTFSHGRFDVLKETVAGFSKALRRIKSGRAAKHLHKVYGVVGEVRAIEVTHGANGWHPHSHAIVFTKRRLSPSRVAAFKERVFRLWEAGCKKSGIGLPSREHGVDVKGAKYAGEYVAKWGFSTEVTKSHIKKAKDGGRTPWQLLADASTGDPVATRLFVEFAKVFKGKRQLFYSHGLKKKLSALAPAPEQETADFKEVVTVIYPLDWDIIVACRLHGHIAALAVQGAEVLEAYLGGLRRCEKLAA